MSGVDWPGVVNQLLYALTYNPAPDQAAIEAMADNMVERRFLTSGPDVYHQAFTEALAAGEILNPRSLPTTVTEEALRDILIGLVAALDTRRPWPAARWTRLPITDWPVAQAPTVATLKASRPRVEERVWHIFDSLDQPGGSAPALVLRLRTGEVIGLVAGTGPRPEDRSTVALRVLDGDPAAALASFRELSGFPDDEVVTT